MYLYLYWLLLWDFLRLHFAKESSARADNLDEVVNLQLILARARSWWWWWDWVFSIAAADDEYFQLLIEGIAAWKKYVVDVGVYILSKCSKHMKGFSLKIWLILAGACPWSWCWGINFKDKLVECELGWGLLVTHPDSWLAHKSLSREGERAEDL